MKVLRFIPLALLGIVLTACHRSTSSCSSSSPVAEWNPATQILMHTPGEELFNGAINPLAALFEYYISNSCELPEEYRMIAEKDGTETAVCDYIAGMTDKFAVMKFQQLYQPRFWQV